MKNSDEASEASTPLALRRHRRAKTGWHAGYSPSKYIHSTEAKPYQLSKKRLLNKKLAAAQKSFDVTCNMTGGGLIISCNSGVFEGIKRSCQKLYSRDGVRIHEVTDACGLVEKVIYKTGPYTVNLFLTTSTIQVNGRGLSRFIKADITEIMAAVDPQEARAINDAILRAVNKKSTETNTNSNGKSGNHDHDRTIAMLPCSENSSLVQDQNEWVTEDESETATGDDLREPQSEATQAAANETILVAKHISNEMETVAENVPNKMTAMAKDVVKETATVAENGANEIHYVAENIPEEVTTVGNQDNASTRVAVNIADTNQSKENDQVVTGTVKVCTQPDVDDTQGKILDRLDQIETVLVELVTNMALENVNAVKEASRREINLLKEQHARAISSKDEKIQALRNAAATRPKVDTSCNNEELRFANSELLKKDEVIKELRKTVKSLNSKIKDTEMKANQTKKEMETLKQRCAAIHRQNEDMVIKSNTLAEEITALRENNDNGKHSPSQETIICDGATPGYLQESSAHDFDPPFQPVSGRKKRKGGHLIITSSLGKHIEASRVAPHAQSRVVVKSISGGTIGDVTNYIRKCNYSHRSVSVLVGGNDISNGSSPQKCKDLFELLIQEVKGNNPQASVCVVKIPPRNQGEEVSHGILTLNRELENVSRRQGVKCIEVIDDLRNDVISDGVHLSRKGTAKLAMALRSAIYEAEGFSYPRFAQRGPGRVTQAFQVQHWRTPQRYRRQHATSKFNMRGDSPYEASDEPRYGRHQQAKYHGPRRHEYPNSNGWRDEPYNHHHNRWEPQWSYPSSRSSSGRNQVRSMHNDYFRKY